MKQHASQGFRSVYRLEKSIERYNSEMVDVHS
jgi:hypothetical protein